MFANTRISAIVFSVGDIARTEHFYRDVLGVVVERQAGDPDHGGDWLLGQLPGGLSLIFFQGEPRPGNSPIAVFELEHGGIDAIAEALAARGVPIVTPVSESPGGWSADFADPDGHVLSVYQDAGQPR